MNTELAMPHHRESVDSVLAKNLVVARVVAGLTQQELASKADVSRATIAQIETGYSDPRLSTIHDLAAALAVPLFLLLAGTDEVRAMTDLLDESANRARGGEAIVIPAAEIDRMQRLTSTGMLKDRARAARVGAGVSRALGRMTPTAQAAAAICSAIFPGPGTLAGMLLGEAIANQAR